MRVTRLLGPVAASVLAAAGLAFLSPAPASAAGGACPGATGVTVVVDFNELPAGAEVQVGCDSKPGARAVDNFANAGFSLTPRATDPGFTCQINSQPADRDCAATDAFWSLWVSDGKSGRWTFATRGVTSLRVPTGGYVAFAWHQGAGQASPPDAVPTPRVPKATPTPSSAPSTQPTQGAKTGGAQGGPKHAPAATPTATSATPTATASATPTAKPTPTATTAAPTPSTPTAASSSALPDVADITAGPETDTAHAEDDSSSLGTWIGVGTGAVVLGAAGAVPLIRRRLG